MKTARSILCLLLAAVFLAALIPGCSCGKPNQEAIQQNDSGEQTSDNSETPWHTADFAAEVTDIGQCYTRDFSPEDVVLSEDGFTEFVRNEVLLVAAIDAPYDEVKALIEANGGEIVGYIEITGDYQVAFSDKTEQELNQLIDTFEQSLLIDDAMLDYVMEFEASGAPVNDKWGGDDWSVDTPSGNNWGMEAINAPGAWAYANEFSDINIGIIDEGFDYEHEDFKYEASNVEKNIIKWHLEDNVHAHGTHVLGTFAAVANNNKGVTGVFPNRINGDDGPTAYVYTSVGVGGKRSFIQYKEIMVELIARNVKVINISTNFSSNSAIVFCASQNDTNEGMMARKIVKTNYADPFGNLLHRLLLLGYDFVICQAAGNDSATKEDEARQQENFYVKDRSRVLGWRHVTKDENEPKDVYFGKLDARYSSIFSAIDNHKDVEDRIIVIGAVENNGKNILGKHNGYSVCDASNWGARVDVLAPGYDIYSTIPNSDYEGGWHGTSMAAPHVSGVAAMVWAANNKLTGADVAWIIMETAYESRKIRDYFEGNDVLHYDYTWQVNGLLDAKAAVEEAIRRRGSSENPGFDNKDLGAIATKVVTEKGESPIVGCEVKVYPIVNGAAADKPLDIDPAVTSDNNGDVYLMLEPGRYKLVVEHNGYQYASILASTSEKEVNYAEWIKLTPIQTVGICNDSAFAINDKNELWVWDRAFYRKEGPDEPHRILENAREIYGSYVIDMDNTLWQIEPEVRKVLKNVRSVEGHYAICTDDSLWKIKPDVSQIMENVYRVQSGCALCMDGSLWSIDGTPQQLDKNVKSYALSSDGLGMFFTIHNDNSLWAWGTGPYLTGEFFDSEIWEGLTYRELLESHGERVYFSLGNGTTDPLSEPTRISKDVKEIVIVPQSVEIEDEGVIISGCTIYIIKTDNSLWGWGSNAGYALGDGSLEDCAAPIHILDNVKELMIIGSVALAWRWDGSVYSWGSGSSALGSGSTESVVKPKKIIQNVRMLATDGVRAYAIKIDDTLWGWGPSRNTSPLGDGDTKSKSIPTQISSDVREIAFVSYHNYSDGALFGDSLGYIIKNDNSLWGWGYGGDLDSFLEGVPAGAEMYQIIGDGDRKTRKEPVHILDNVYCLEEVAHMQDALVITTDGAVWSWGFDTYTYIKDCCYYPIKVFDGVKLP